MEDRQADTVLEDVYKTECGKLDQDPELPLDLTLKCLDVPSSELGGRATQLENYNNIVEKVVRDTLFSQHMCKRLTTDGMWTFKKQFTAHLALSGFTSYMLKAKFPAPSNLVFAKNSGQIFLSDFHPGMSSFTPRFFFFLLVFLRKMKQDFISFAKNIQGHQDPRRERGLSH